jgi:hypothetical protein
VRLSRPRKHITHAADRVDGRASGRNTSTLSRRRVVEERLIRDLRPPTQPERLAESIR